MHNTLINWILTSKINFIVFNISYFTVTELLNTLDEATGEMKIGVNTWSNREAKTQMMHPLPKTEGDRKQ